MWFFIRVLIIPVLLILIEYYFSKKVINSVKLFFPSYPKKKRKRITLISLFFINLYPLIALVIGILSLIQGTRLSFPPENALFEYFILYPFWIFILIIFQAGFLFVPVDILRLIFFPFYKKYREKVKRYNAYFVAVLILLCIIYVPIRVIYDYNVVSVRPVEYFKKDIPENLDGFKITLISDLQADRYTDEDRLNNFIDKVNSTHPDLVLVAGDIITSSPNYINKGAKELGKIKSKYGIYSCVGDHDNWAYRDDNSRSLKEITEALAEYNIPMIDNGRKVLNIDSSKIGVTFITNTYVGTIPDNVLDSLARDTSGVDLNIFLTHQPRQFIIDKAIQYNYDLFLAGHTHGGQITFFFPFINLTPTLLETTRVKGNFRFGDMLMIVTRGLGMSLAPVRYNSTPEVTAIILRKGN